MPEEVVRGAMMIRVNSLSRYVPHIRRVSCADGVLRAEATRRSDSWYSTRSSASFRRESHLLCPSVAASVPQATSLQCVSIAATPPIVECQLTVLQLSYIAGAITGHPDVKVITRM